MTKETQTLVLDAVDSRRVAMLLRWPHTFGDEAHCLARLILRPAPVPAVAVLSEISSNRDSRGITGDMARVAEAFMEKMRLYAPLSPEDMVWFAHYGEFSSPDAFGAPETFTRVDMVYREGRFHDDLSGHHRLTPDEVRDQVSPLQLHPAPEVLTELQSVRI
ncbi:hypothetical protein ACH4U7_24980 [Streptomyces sp. NPDC020845]|uniref:hypothetical protein n=1 Tax=Streptomyces sp. NPDC020845 TaxID=3365096 RepID=UPI003799FEF5